MSAKARNKRFNSIDVFIILLVVLCIAAIYFRGMVASWIGVEKELDEYKITFSVKQIRSTSDKYLIIGNEVYLSNGGLLGKLSEKSSLPAKVFVNDQDGKPVEVSYPKDTCIDVTGSLTCKGIMNDDGFYLNGTYSISPGAVLSVYTDMLDFTITVTDISKIQK